MMNKKNKKGQTWTVEFIMAFLIFSTAILLSVKMIASIYTSTGFSDLMKQSEAISENLMTEGFPKEWTSSDVIKIGLLTNNSIDNRKLGELYDLAYPSSKSKFGISQNYFIYFKNKYDNLSIFYELGKVSDIEDGCGYGDPNVDTDWDGGKCVLDFRNLDYDNFIKLSRFVVYDKKMITMEIYSWD